jgi:hypothetical protein
MDLAAWGEVCAAAFFERKTSSNYWAINAPSKVKLALGQLHLPFI